MARIEIELVESINEDELEEAITNLTSHGVIVSRNGTRLVLDGPADFLEKMTRDALSIDAPIATTAEAGET
ncbi:MAG: hypothetical protein HRU44_04830 [Candidatus Thalassarchaeum sp.]|nr:hypothetical protein [Candidatus Thalassarchaeum sp.]